ncbi:type III secretion system translocon subunit SctE [Stenotrophomonas sp. SORGH_AS_0321]|uniref:type III secretion system translocon subunit SctE n=1 Tax=Stenotrophomonas sp. SORGH_AS_0321 TaxID=3041787 RepID=UPI00286C1682|nr:type III secretion system translocon subunit SctE [Stenotrophomonas sp. SORGH_AS_0321]
MQAVLGDQRLDRVEQRLQAYRSQLQARAQRAEHLSAEMQAALDAAMAAQEAADTAAGEAGAAEGALQAAREHVQRLQSELDALDPSDPAAAAKRAELAAAREVLQQAQARFDAASRALYEAVEVLDATLGELDALETTLRAFNHNQPMVAGDSERKLNASDTLAMLMAVISQLMGKHADNTMKNMSEFTIQTIKARQAKEQERIRQHEEELQRARDAEKKTGCAGKIFGWIGAAVGVIASIGAIVVGALHGNVALIAGGVMGMMLTIDSIVGMTTGFSVVGKVVEQLGKVIASALIAFGVAEALARQIGSILATVVVMVAIIAAMVFTGNLAAASRTAALAAKGAVETTAMTVARIVEQASKVMQFVAQAAGAIGQTVHNVGQVHVAGIMIDVKKLLKKIQESQFDNQLLQDMMRMIAEAGSETHRLALELVAQMSEVQQDRADSVAHVIGHMRHRA